MKALRLVLISLLLSGCAVVSSAETPTPVIEQTVTLASTPSLTPTPDRWLTQMAALAATQTAQVGKAQATKTAEADKAASMLEEIRSAASQIEGLDISNATLVFGPASDSLVHKLDNKVRAFNPDLSLKNFITSITFVNPYDTSTTGTWDYGILFRNEHRNKQYRLIILSNQSWTLVDSRTWTHIFSKNDKHLMAKAGEENTIWLIVIDAKAYLFINGTYAECLNASAKLTAGDVSPATGLYRGNETDKKTTKFHDFIVWSLP